MALSIPLEELPEYIDLTPELDEEKLQEIGNLVVDEFDNDKTSRSDWEDRYEKAMKLATQVEENKSFPWPKAANMKYSAPTEPTMCTVNALLSCVDIAKSEEP